MSEMSVGGSVSLRGPVEFKSIDIGGSLKVEGDLLVSDDLRIGGSARIEGNLRAGRVKVGGSIRVSGRIEAGELTIGGSADFSEGIIGDLDVGGSISALEILVKNARIAGSARGLIIGDHVVVEKKSRIKGRIVARKLVVKREAEVEEAYAVEAMIEKKAEVDSLSCVACTLGNDAWIGLLRYKQSYEDRGANVEAIEKADEIPELDLLRKLGSAPRGKP
ncbi:MAG: polymer-forming cytoskeletal protein [Desulfurococcales archaeon]|nr:polymer-forming cytoskeletal protein [Desulfurococcales archaeon]